MFALTPLMRGTALLPRTEPFRMLTEPFNRMFDRIFSEWPLITLPLEEMIETPTRFLTMEENEKEFVVRTELPGFTPEELTVELRGDVLRVEAEHKVPAETTGKRAERAYVHVRRMITLPPEAELDKMERAGLCRLEEPHSRRLPRRTAPRPAQPEDQGSGRQG